MRNIFTITLFCLAIQLIHAQGYNHDMGEDSLYKYESLADKLFKLEKKHDAFNVWVNFAASFQATDDDGKWETRFANRELRLEIAGNINQHLSYRLRHQLNKSNAAKGGDNFAKATDLAWIAWHFNDKLNIQAGKICLNWGGFEYDENPIFIYRYSDFVDAMDIYMAGVGVSYRPVPSQEFVLQGTNTYNGSFHEEWGHGAVAVDTHNGNITRLQKSRLPLTFIANWNGNFCNNRLQTRWAWGIQSLAKGKTGRLLTLGQQLNMPRLQWYVDYYGGWYDIDHLRFANKDLTQWAEDNPVFDSRTEDAEPTANDTPPLLMADVRYHSLVTKANWQFATRWNLMLKATYETVSAAHKSNFHNYRKSFVYATSVEYYPIEKQNLRFFLAYIGHKVDYSKRSALQDNNTNRIELGLMYRMKCF